MTGYFPGHLLGLESRKPSAALLAAGAKQPDREPVSYSLDEVLNMTEEARERAIRQKREERAEYRREFAARMDALHQSAMKSHPTAGPRQPNQHIALNGANIIARLNRAGR